MRNQHARVFREHPLLTACLLVVVGAGAGYLAAGPASGELESALLVGSTTLVFGALLGGAVKFLLDDVQRLRDQRHEQARFVKQLLDDLKSVYDRVERVRILIAAHRSACTYGNEMRDLIDSAVRIRNVTRALDHTSGVLEDRRSDLRAAVIHMTEYLDALTDEFQKNYKADSRRTGRVRVSSKARARIRPAGHPAAEPGFGRHDSTRAPRGVPRRRLQLPS
jgi:hypothetical protein